MEIECPNCGEPWDTYHMRHDEAHEWGLSNLELNDILESGRFSGKEDRARNVAKAAGWEFAADSLLSFTRCPCCKDRTPLRDAITRQRAVATVAELLDGDDDGMVAMLEELPAFLS